MNYISNETALFNCKALPKGEAVLQQNQIVSSVFILREGLLQIVTSEEHIREASRQSGQSGEDGAAFEFLSASQSKNGKVFLDAATNLYNRVCPVIHLSVGSSIGPLVTSFLGNW